MLAAYLVALVIGAVLLGVSLAGGDHHGGHEASAGHGDHGGEPGQAALAALASVRFWTYFLAFGGATGALLRLIAGTAEPLAALLAAGVGLAGGLFAQTLMSRASRAVESGVMSERELVGRTAEVLVPFARAQTGKVRLQVRESLVDVLATTDDEAPLAEKEQVVIVDMEQGRALVARAKE